MVEVRSITLETQNMKCPACDRDLSPTKAGGVTLDVCQGGCGGIWFDAFELNRVVQPPEGGRDIVLSIERDAQLQVDPARKRKCPKCADLFLMRHFITRLKQVEVDDCPGCGGLWLDAGELSRMKAEKETVAKEDAARAVRAGVSTAAAETETKPTVAFASRLSVSYVPARAK
jgi:hypothetical protein